METKIVQYLFIEDLLKIGDKEEIRSICDLISIELENDNFEKTLELSEETIKLNSKAPVGWLIKAISELELIDKKDDFLGNSIKSMKKCLSLTSSIPDTILLIKSIYESLAIIKFSKNFGSTTFLSNLISIGKWITDDEFISFVGKRFNRYDDNIKKQILDKNITHLEKTLPFVYSLIEAKKNISSDIIPFIDNALNIWYEANLNILVNEYNNLALSCNKKLTPIINEKTKLLDFINNQIIIPEVEKILLYSELIGLSKSKFNTNVIDIYSELKRYFSEFDEKTVEEIFRDSEEQQGKGCFPIIGTFILFAGAGAALDKWEFGTFTMILTAIWLFVVFPLQKKKLVSTKISEISSKITQFENDILQNDRPTINDVNESEIVSKVE